MPYINIHWIKVKLEIINDKRFLFDLNESQKLLFLGLLILAGVTKNEVPDDEEFIKNRLNLSENSQKIRENLEKIFSTFPKTVSKNGVIKFRNFNDLHNPLRNAEGTPLDSQGNAKGVHRVEKSRIDKIREEYIRLKGFDISNFSSDDYGRTAKAIKNLLVKSSLKDDLVVKALEWAAGKKWCDWTLETVLRKWADFMKDEKRDYLPESLKGMDK